MSNDVFSLGYFRELHDFKISTAKKRIFIANIFKEQNGYSGDLVILDDISKNSIHHILPHIKIMPEDIFIDHLDTINKYLLAQGDSDFIEKIHNPCNTPFVAKEVQQTIVNNQKINAYVTVNKEEYDNN